MPAGRITDPKSYCAPGWAKALAWDGRGLIVKTSSSSLFTVTESGGEIEVWWRHVTGSEAGNGVDGVRRWRFNTGGGSVVVVSKLGFRFFRGGRGAVASSDDISGHRSLGAEEGGSAAG
jgi:hypothetical protein